MKHRFDAGESKTGYHQQTFVIEVDALTAEVVAQLPEYLITNIHQIFEADEKVKTDTMWPVAIDVGGKLFVSEKVMWTQVFETLPNAKDLVTRYVNELCRLAKQTKWGDLLFNDEYHFAGSFALIPFLDRYLVRSKSISREALPVYKCFIEFIRRCDLDVETFQDEYIEKVLVELVCIDNQTAIELLCLRLCNGQLATKDFRYLHLFFGYFIRKPVPLRELIDYVTDSGCPDVSCSCRVNESTYLTFCAAIYGENLKETEEVMDYVRKKVDLRLVRASQMRDIQRIRSECEAFRAYQLSQEGFYDTSFHRYDLQEKKWLPLVAASKAL
jgi:hypothetical protein